MILERITVSHSSTPNQTGLPDFGSQTGSQNLTNIGRRDGPLTYRIGNDFGIFGLDISDIIIGFTGF